MFSRKESMIVMVGAALALSGSLSITTAITAPSGYPAATGKTAAAGKKPVAGKASVSGKKPIAGKAPAAGKSAVQHPVSLIPAGMKVYDTSGCASCHVIGGKGGTGGPDLSQTGANPAHTLEWFQVQVTTPKAHNPASTMPSFASTVKGKDLTSLATFLSSLKPTSSDTTAPPASAPVAAPDPVLVAAVEKAGGIVQPLAQNDNHLDVSFHMAGPSATDASLEPLVRLKHVVHLDLGTTSITDAGLARIHGMKELVELHLERTKITDKGLAHLKEMSNLYYLNLYGTAVTDAGLDMLSHLSNLRHLYVWQTKVTEEGAGKLRKALPKVEIVTGLETVGKT